MAPRRYEAGSVGYSNLAVCLTRDSKTGSNAHWATQVRAKRPSHFSAVCQSAEGQVFFMLESGNALIDAASFLILLHDLSLMLDGGEPSGPSRR